MEEYVQVLPLLPTALPFLHQKGRDIAEVSNFLKTAHLVITSGFSEWRTRFFATLSPSPELVLVFWNGVETLIDVNSERVQEGAIVHLFNADG